MANANFKFRFEFSKLPDLSVQVIGFKGSSQLNAAFSFEVTALIRTGELHRVRGEDLFSSPVTLSIRDESRGDATKGGAPQAYDAKWHGILTSLGEGAGLGDHTFLSLGMGPSLSVLSGRRQNRIHLDSTGPDIVKDSLSFGGFDASRLSLRLDPSSYPKREFVFQREEDLLGFVLRTLEREGIALWYDQSGDHDGVVLSDSSEGFQSLLCGQGELSLTHAATSGLSPSGGEPLLHAFAVEKTVPPKTLRLRDYNWANPNQPLEILLTVDGRGRGEHYLYGEHFESEGEGERLARIRKEGLLCRSEIFRGEASAPGIMPGMLFGLNGHPNDSYNQRYLVTSASYEGRQELAAGLGAGPPGPQGEAPGLRVSFDFQRLGVPYRPPQRTARPDAGGPVTAWIDGAGSGDSPELDAYGRYKVLLPLDASGRGQGKASCWVRMAQPYVGKGYGQSFPLTPGTEVLLSFVDGNPDRPVIQGAIPNGETGSLVNSSCPNLAGLGTKGGGSLTFRETGGAQSAILDSGSRRGTVALTANSPTAALIQTDTFNTLATFEQSITGVRAYDLAGMTYKVTASSDKMGVVLTAMSALQAAAQAADKAVGGLDPNSGSDDQPANTYTLASRALNFAGMGFGMLWYWLESIDAVQQFKQTSLAQPHRNVIAITADESGSNCIYRCKLNPNSQITQAVILLGIINDIMSSLGGVPDAVLNIKDNINNPGTGKDKIAKIISTATSVGTDLTQVITSLFPELLDTLANKNFTKGILIDNKDSYVSFKAKTVGSLSSNGPVYLESGPDLVTDLMTDAYLDTKIPKHFIARSVRKSYSVEEPDPVLNPPHDYFAYYHGYALVLRGELIKALAEEVNLSCYQTIFARAGNAIQFLVGETPGYVNPINLAEADCPDPSLRQALGDICASEVPISAPDFRSGILFRTNQASAPIILETLNAASGIFLKQGMAGVAEYQYNPRIFNFDTREIEFKVARTNMGLRLIKSSQEAKLSTGENTYLDLMPNEVNLMQSPNNFLQITPYSSTLKHKNQISLKVGTAGIGTTINGTSIAHNAPSVKVNGNLVRLG